MGQIELAVKVTTHAEHMESPAWTWHTRAALLTPIPASTKPQQGELGPPVWSFPCLKDSSLHQIANKLLGHPGCWQTPLRHQRLCFVFVYIRMQHIRTTENLEHVGKKIKGGNKTVPRDSLIQRHFVHFLAFFFPCRVLF